MKVCQPHYIVQCKHTGEFLIPYEGYISTTRMFGEAGHFDEVEEALDTADGYLESFEIYTVYLPSKDI